MPRVEKEPLDPAHINRALGLFLLAFGVVILISVAFTVTTAGMVTNFLAGAILTGIGAGMTWRAQWTLRKSPPRSKSARP